MQSFKTSASAPTYTFVAVERPVGFSNPNCLVVELLVPNRPFFPTHVPVRNGVRVPPLSSVFRDGGDRPTERKLSSNVSIVSGEPVVTTKPARAFSEGASVKILRTNSSLSRTFPRLERKRLLNQYVVPSALSGAELHYFRTAKYQNAQRVRTH